jgi:hypothetical protein
MLCRFGFNQHGSGMTLKVTANLSHGKAARGPLNQTYADSLL